MLEGDGTWRPGGAIAVPAAQTRDDPGGPGEAVPEMRIVLLPGSARDLRVDSLQGRHPVLGEGQAGRFGAAPVTGLHQLEGEGGGLGGNRRELQPPLGAGNLTGFEVQPLWLPHAEE